MKLITTALLLSLAFSAQATNEIDMKIEAALADEARPQADRDRDRNRRPADTLNFFGLKERVSASVLEEPGFEKVIRIETKENLHRPEGSKFYVMDDFNLDVDGLDMVLTFRNLHNFGPEARAMMNREVFKSLKHGGLYGVVDHTRRHMEKLDNENRRRIDPVLIIREMLDQGFEFVDYSDIHFRADDELEYEVGRRSVSGNTDRFTFLFRKP